MKTLIHVILWSTFVLTNAFSQQYKDCNDPLLLCGSSPFLIESTSGAGEVDTDISTSCLNTEQNSIWIELNILIGGDLVFEITPNSEATDLDFIVFKIENNDCQSKSVERCMATGAIDLQNPQCLGATGLAFGETDVEEFAGCSTGDNNFLAPLDVLAGDKYLLMINDFSLSQEHYTIDFNGSAQIDCVYSSIEDNFTQSESPLFYASQINERIEVKANYFKGEGILRIYSMSGQMMFEQIMLPNQLAKVNSLKFGGSYIISLETSNSNYSEIMTKLR